MLELRGITKTYQEKVLDEISFDLPNTGFVLLSGPSGCGKTTLLHILGGLDSDYTGQLLWQGKECRKNKKYRKKVCFIFQQFHLLDYLKAYQNSILSRYFKKTKTPSMALDFPLKNRLSTYSGGQKQRIAILRCLYNQPNILLCDEPTSCLDKSNQLEIMQQLKELSKQCLVIVSSHQLDEKYFDEVIKMQDGKITCKTKAKESGTLVEKQDSQNPYPLFTFAFLQSKSKSKRNLKILFGVSLALFSILFSFSLLEATNSQIKEQIYKLLPSNTLTILPDSKELEYEQIKEVTKEYFTYVEYEDAYCLGISFDASYQNENCIYIGDSTKQITNVDVGEVTKNNNEVVLASSTAKKLLSSGDVTSIIGETVYCWYTYEQQVLSIELEVVGVSEESVLLDTAYFNEYSNIAHIEELFGSNDYKIMLAMVELDSQVDPSKIQATLENQLDGSKIEVSSFTISDSIDEIFSQVQIVLFLFCGLAIVSACFLVGQVLFLSVVERKKEIAIIRCFGADQKQVFLLIVLESILIVTGAYVGSVFCFLLVQGVINEWLTTYLSIELIGGFLNVNIGMFSKVYLSALFLSVICSSFPAYYGCQQDIVEALRER